MNTRGHGTAVLALIALAVTAMAAVPAAAKDTIVFSTAPTQPPAQTRQQYQPLADYLSKVTGKKIVLEPARSFLEYTNAMRAGKYDLLFDGPQFVGWRMKHLGHHVLAKLPGSIVFVVVVRDDAGVAHVADLAGKQVCSFASPNLLTLGFLDLFPNPAQLPLMVRSPTFMGALQCVKSGHGVAAVMRQKFWDKRTPEQKKGLRLLYTSNTPYPHRAFSISDDVDAATRDKIKAALLSDAGTNAGAPILKRFRVKRFVAAPAKEYQGMGRLLKPVWGFSQ
ncbi:MAG: phosphate/phosphite/phosphonate ABC transporter substrate-binding protein [Gammaproteobacteria bacterium]